MPQDLFLGTCYEVDGKSALTYSFCNIIVLLELFNWALLESIKNKLNHILI